MQPFKKKIDQEITGNEKKTLLQNFSSLTEVSIKYWADIY